MRTGKGLPIGLIIAAAVSSACSPNQRIVNSSTGQWSNTPNTQATPVRTTFEQDVEAMRTADFTFIFVFRRKDGSPLDAEDRRFASQTLPPEMNRRTLSDEGKAIIIGSNFRMPADDWNLMTERFAFENFSKPDAPPPINANAQPKR